jgi:hypothetical protein
MATAVVSALDAAKGSIEGSKEEYLGAGASGSASTLENKGGHLHNWPNAMGVRYSSPFEKLYLARAVFGFAERLFPSLRQKTSKGHRLS